MKCAVSDFDRTLYVDGQISPKNIQAIKRWQAAGHWFVVATGRNESSLRAKLDLYDCQPDAYILNNGAVVRLKDGKEIYCKLIDNDTVREILQYLYSVDRDGSGVSMRDRKVNVLSRDNTTTQKPSDGVITIDQIGELKEVVQIHTRRPSDINWIISLCRDLNERFPEITAYANVWNADIMAHGVDKAAGIGCLEQYVGGFDEILTVGDSENDVRMIRDYGGVTVPDGCENARNAAVRIVSDVAEYLDSCM